MIYTITFNPALDYIVDVQDFKLGRTNRSYSETIYSGGKGINVSMVLKNMGIESICLGFIAGFTGDEIQNGVSKSGCKTDFIKLKNGLSRINVKLRSDVETEINGNGPKIEIDEIEQLYKKIDNIKDGDILVISGSVPDSLPSDIYEKIMQQLEKRTVKIVVDATNQLLVKSLKYKPFLIKPNNHELEEIFSVEIKSEDDIIKYAKKLQKMGAENVLISMAEKGGILISKDEKTFRCNAPVGKVINSVGAGDSMIAGFLAGYIDNGNIQTAFKIGIATGSASAFSEKLATKDEVFKLLKTID